MTQDKNKAIALIIPLIVKNNAGKVAIALRDAGYSKSFIPGPELEARLFQLYTANPDMFFEVIKTIPWNYGEAETNKPEIKDELIKLVSEGSDIEISKDNWWQQLIVMLSPVNIEERQLPAITKNYGVVILLVVAIIGISVALYYMFKS